MGIAINSVCGVRINAGAKSRGFTSCLGEGKEQHKDKGEEEN